MLNVTAYRQIVELKSKGYPVAQIAEHVGQPICDVQTILDFMYQRLIPPYFGELACLLNELGIPYKKATVILSYLKAHNIKLKEGE